MSFFLTAHWIQNFLFVPKLFLKRSKGFHWDHWPLPLLCLSLPLIRQSYRFLLWRPQDLISSPSTRLSFLWPTRLPFRWAGSLRLRPPRSTRTKVPDVSRSLYLPPTSDSDLPVSTSDPLSRPRPVRPKGHGESIRVPLHKSSLVVYKPQDQEDNGPLHRSQCRYLVPGLSWTDLSGGYVPPLGPDPRSRVENQRRPVTTTTGTVSVFWPVQPRLQSTVFNNTKPLYRPGWVSMCYFRSGVGPRGREDPGPEQGPLTTLFTLV